MKSYEDPNLCYDQRENMKQPFRQKSFLPNSYNFIKRNVYFNGGSSDNFIIKNPYNKNILRQLNG